MLQQESQAAEEEDLDSLAEEHDIYPLAVHVYERTLSSAGVWLQGALRS